MSIVSRILAIVIMGGIALGLIAVPMGSILSANAAGSPTVAQIFAIIAPFAAVAALTILIALWAPTARIAWGRLCVLNGLAAFALPLQGIVLSVFEGSRLPQPTTPELQAAAKLGAGLGGVAVTGALAFVGFFVGVIFIVAGYFVLRGAPRYYY